MLNTLKMVYHSYSHSVIHYGIIFWGNSSYSNSIFKPQKGIIGIIKGVRIKDSCREFFKLLNILPFISQCIFSLLLFMVNNNSQFLVNSAQQGIIGIIKGVRIKDSCRELFKLLNILPLISQCIFSLLLFMVNNNSQFLVNSEIH